MIGMHVYHMHFFIALWYNVSTGGVARLKRKLNAFIDIEFGFELLKSDAVYRYFKFVR